MESKLLYLMTREAILGSPAARLSLSSPQLLTGEDLAVFDTTDFAINSAVVSDSGITVSIQGYYFVQACVTFSSSSSSTYIGPPVGAQGYVSIFDTMTETELTRGSTQVQTLTGSEYTSVAADIVYLGQGDQIMARIISSTPSGSLYAWSDSDSISTYFSLSYVCV